MKTNQVFAVNHSYTINAYSDLFNAFTAINALASAPADTATVNFNANITIDNSAGLLPFLKANQIGSVTINGGNFVLDGASTYQGLFIDTGTVGINQITIQNTIAKGGNGGSSANAAGGGGGGLGAGGGLFVANDPNHTPSVVTLTDVTFSPTGNHCAATGGNGGSSANSSSTGCGGGGGGGLDGITLQGTTGGFSGNGGNGGAGTTGGGPGDNSQGAASAFGGGGGGSSPASDAAATNYATLGYGGPGGSKPNSGNGFGGGFSSFGGGGGGGGAFGSSSWNGGQANTVAVAGQTQGFGGGGGGTARFGGSGAIQGPAGFGGGIGGGVNAGGGGGGGGALGGAIFVMGGATLNVLSTGASQTWGTSNLIAGIAGGGGGNAAHNGSTFGGAIFLHSTGTNNNITFTPAATMSLTISDTIADEAGNGGSASNKGSLIMNGAGTLVLGGANSYSAGTTIKGNGTVSISATNNLGSAASTITFGDNTNTSGTLSLTAAITVAHPFSLVGTGANTLTNTGAFASTFSGAITGAAGTNLTIGGNNTVTTTLSGANNFGGIIVNAPTSLTTNNQTINQLSGTSTLSIIGKTLSLGNDNSSSTFNQQISGAGGSITKGGTGAFTLTSTNTYTGPTTLSSGTLNANNATNPFGTGALALNGGTLQSTLVATPVTLGNLSFTVGAAGSTIAGANNLSLTNNGALSGLLSVTNTAVTTLNGVISSTGVFGITLNAVGGNLTLTGHNTYTGTTTLTNGTLSANNVTNPLGTGTLVLNGGTLQQTIGGTVTLGNSSFTVGGSGSTIGGTNNLTLANGTLNSLLTVTNTATTILNGLIQGTNGITLNGAGSSILQLTYAGNTYSGLTIVSNGTLEMGAAGALPTAGNLTVNYPGIFALNGFSQTAGDINGNAGSSITLSAGETLSFGTANNTANFRGVISGGNGTGGITKQGTGTQTLSGANTFPGTTTINNGTLEMGAAGALPTAGNLTVNYPGIFALNGFSQTAGDINGNAGSSITLSAGETLSFGTANNTANFRGVISGGNGTGGITKQGTGTQILSGPNTFRGTTTLNNGTLNANNATDPLGTGPLALNGGTLQQTMGGTVTLGNSSFTVGVAGSTIGGANNLTLTNNGTLSGLLSVNNTASTIFNGAINSTGAFGITMNGAGGNCILNNTNTYTGPTTVNAGRLSVNGSITSPVNVNAGGTLGGTGTINGNVSNNGTVSVGNPISTLTINGNYTSGPNSTIIVELSPSGQSSDLVITGTAQVNGTLNIIADPGMYFGDEKFPILSSGAVTGTFTTVSPPFIGLFKPVVLYSPTGLMVELGFVRNSFITPMVLSISNVTANEIALANYFDSLPTPAIGSDFSDNVLGPISALLSGQALLSALDSINPGRMVANTGVVQTISMNINSISSARLAYLHHKQDAESGSASFNSTYSNSAFSNNKGDAFNYLKLVKGKTKVKQQQNFNTTQSGISKNALANMQPLMQFANQKTGLWIYGLGTYTDQHARNGDPGFNAKTGGIMVAMDHTPYKDLYVGIGLGQAVSFLKFNQNAGNGRLSHYFVDLYGSWAPNHWYIDAALLAGLIHNQTSQHIQFLQNTQYALDRNAIGRHDGYEVTPHLGTGYEIELAIANFTPFVNLDLSAVHEVPYTTEGALSLNQNIRSRNSALLRSELGLKVAKTFEFAKCNYTAFLSPNASLSVINKKVIKKGIMTASFVGEPGSFNSEFYTRDQNLIAPSVGVDLNYTNGVFLTTQFTSEFGKAYQEYEINLRVGMPF